MILGLALIACFFKVIKTTKGTKLIYQQNTSLKNWESSNLNMVGNCWEVNKNDIRIISC